MKEIDDSELTEFIFERLVQRGIVVNREDILTILDLEMEYMVKEGIAVPQEGAGGPYADL